MLKRPIVLTGFEPFGGDGRNPSAEVLAALAADPPVAGLVAEVLPVVFADAGRRVEQLIAEHRPAAWVGLGLHAGATAITLERRAANEDDATLPDNAGDVRQGAVIQPGGPSHRPATLLWDAIAAELAREGVATRPSDSAGRFVCNHCFYRAAAAAERLACTVRVGFIHLPWPSDWPRPAGRPAAGHDVPFAVQVAAVRRCLEVVAAHAGDGATSGSSYRNPSTPTV